MTRSIKTYLGIFIDRDIFINRDIFIDQDILNENKQINWHRKKEFNAPAGVVFDREINLTLKKYFKPGDSNTLNQDIAIL